MLMMLMDRGDKPKLPKARGGIGWQFTTHKNKKIKKKFKKFGNLKFLTYLCKLLGHSKY